MTTTTTGGGGEGKIVFGQPALLSGPIAFIQTPVSAAADMAVKMINDAGGPLGQTVDIVRRDTAYDPSQARQVVRKLVNVDNAKVILGLTSTTSVPNAEFLINQLKHPVITMYSGTPYWNTRGGDHGTPQDLSDDEWYWRSTASDSETTAGSAIHLKQATDAKNVGLIHTKTAGARTWAKSYKKAIEAVEGLTLAKTLAVESGKTTYRSDLASLYEADLDVFTVAVEGAPDGITLLQEWHQAGYGGKVILSNPLKNKKVRTEVGDLLKDEWVRLVNPASSGPYADTFPSKFNDFVKQSDDYKDTLTKNHWSGATYDAFTAAALAIQRAGKATPEAIERNLGPIARPPGKKVTTFVDGKKELEKGNEINFQGALSDVNFDKTGDIFTDGQVYALAPKKWKKVTRVKADKIKSLLKEMQQ